MDKINIKLMQLLEERGITRYELAKRTGIQFQTINSYCRNQVVRYDGHNLLKICKVLDCEVGDILKIENDDNPIVIG